MRRTRSPQRVKNAWDKGFLRAASVSWVPVESASDESGRRRDVTSELVEWSLVPVPADPDALRESYRRLVAEALAEDEGAEAVRRLVDEVKEGLGMAA